MNYLKAAVKLGLLVGLSGVSQAVWANCWTNPTGPVGYTVTLPPTPIILDKGTTSVSGPVGAPIFFTTGPHASVSLRSGPCYLHMKYISAVTDSGYGDGVYKTNVPGIGFKIYTNNDKVFHPYWTEWLVWPLSGLSPHGASGGAGFTHQLRLQFYITGPVSPGVEVNFSATIQGVIDGSVFETSTINGTVPFIRGGCRTPDIRVNLKSHSSASFPKLYDTSPETPFDFQLNECEPGMNAVSYTFKPATGVTLEHAGNSVYQRLTLSSSSTAKNVVVQVMNADGSMVKFNEKIKFTGYNKATGGSYRIPMKARYMRIGNITNGTANSAMEFIMHYE